MLNCLYESSYIVLSYSSVCELAALVLGASDIPYISTGCTSSLLSDKQTFRTFSRVVGPRIDLAAVFLMVLQHMDWKRVCIITSTDRESTDTGVKLESTFADANIVTFRCGWSHATSSISVTFYY